MSREYGGWGRTSYLSFSKYVFIYFATCDLMLSCCKITLWCLCSYSGQFFSSMVGSDASVVFDSDLPWWLHLVWPPNAKQKLQTIDIQLCHWCWCIAGLTPQSSMLNVFIVYPLFISSHDRREKPFLFCCWSSCSHVTRYCSMSLDFNLDNTQCPCFWLVPNAFKHFKTVVGSTPNDSASSPCIWHESSWSNASNSSSSNFFIPSAFFIFNIKIIGFDTSKIICMLFLTEHGCHKSQQEFCVLQLQITFE